MRIWNTCKRRQDIKLWLPISEFKRNILQSFGFGGKIGSLMRSNLENTHWALGIRGVLCVCTENWAVLRLPKFSFCCSANRPRNPRGGHSFCRRHQILGDWGCCLLIIPSLWQLTAHCLQWDKVWNTTCILFSSLSFSVVSSWTFNITVSRQMWLAGSCFCMVWAPHGELKREINILESRKVTMPWTGRKQDSEVSLWL